MSLPTLHLYVNQATGNDSNSGRVPELPFATYAQAVEAILGVGYTIIHLTDTTDTVYEAVPIKGYELDSSTRLDVVGTHEKVLAGPFVVTSVDTLWSLTIDGSLGDTNTYGKYTLRVDSGAKAGAHITMCRHTNHQITVCSRFGMPAPGDHVSITKPYVTCHYTSRAIIATGCVASNVRGQIDLGAIKFISGMRLINVCVTSDNYIYIDQSTVQFIGVHCEGFLWPHGGTLLGGICISPAPDFPVLNIFDLYGWGIGGHGDFFIDAYGTAAFLGNFSSIGTDPYDSPASIFFFAGIITANAAAQYNGNLYLQSIGDPILIEGSGGPWGVGVHAQRMGKVYIDGVTFNCPGDCMLAVTDGQILIGSHTFGEDVAASGGSQPGAGKAGKAIGGGTIRFWNQAPTVTGGTLNEDFQVEAQVFAKSMLANPATGVADANTGSRIASR